MKEKSQSRADGVAGRGMFWLPHTPERVVSGEFRASFNDISLHVDDSLTPLATSPFDSGPDNHPLVLGVVDGRPVTLESCFTRSKTYAITWRTRTERYGALRAAIGAHVDAIQVQEVRFGFDGLNVWAPPPRPVVTHDDGAGHAGVQATYTEPEQVSVSLPLGEVVLSWFGAWEAGAEFSVRPDTLVTVRPAQPLGLEDLVRTVITPLRSLVALGLSTPCPLTSLSATITPDAIVRATGEVDLYFLASGQAPGLPHGRTDGFFRFEDVRAQFAEVLPRWFDSWASLRTVCYLYFAHLFTPSPHVEVRFLFACQAAELLHGTVGDALVRPKAELLALVKDLTRNIPDEHKPWVTTALVESNRKRLRQQLLEFVGDAPASVRAAIGDAERFAASVTRTRNAYTHWTARDDAATGGPLLALIVQLRLLVQARLMRGIGLDDAQIDRLVERSGVALDIEHWKTAEPIA